MGNTLSPNPDTLISPSQISGKESLPKTATTCVLFRFHIRGYGEKSSATVTVTLTDVDRLAHVENVFETAKAQLQVLLKRSALDPQLVLKGRTVEVYPDWEAGDEMDAFMATTAPVVFRVHILHVPEGSDLLVKMLDGKVLQLPFRSEATIEDVKTAIWMDEGIPTDQQRLYFDDKLLEDGRTLRDYLILSGSTVHLVMRLRGGGGPAISFADVSRGSNMQVRKWARNAPPWRVAEPGLCIEGYCRTSGCAARDQLVICNKGFCFFDLVVNTSTSCPLCQAYIQPETCAFNNCEWRFSGTKVPTGSRRPEMVKNYTWTLASDRYERFRDTPSGKASWARLLLETRRAAAAGTVAAPECAICSERLVNATARGGSTDPVVTTPCRHQFHAHCLAGWTVLGHTTCPECRLAPV